MFGFVNFRGRLKGGRTLMRCQDREGKGVGEAFPAQSRGLASHPGREM